MRFASNRLRLSIERTTATIEPHACARPLFQAASAGCRIATDPRRRSAGGYRTARMGRARATTAAPVARVLLGVASDALRRAGNGLAAAFPDGVGPVEADRCDAAVRQGPQL